MKTKWTEVTIDQIKANRPASVAMGPFGSDIKTDNFVDYGVPVIRGNNLTHGFVDTGFVFVTEEKADELKSSNAFSGDIVFTHRGTIGQVGIIPNNASFPRYVVSQSQMKLTCNSEVAHPLFVYYFFKSPLGQYRLLANTSQTGVPAIAQPLTTLRQIKVPLPPLDEQRAIAHILGSLDDKIELNRRMNATLEATARAIFKSWFMDFDPVRAKARGEQPVGMDAETAALFPDAFEDSELGPIPSGWRVESLRNHIKAVKGLSYKGSGLASEGMPLHNLNSVHEGGGYKYEGIKFYTGDYQDRHLVKPGDVIVTNTEQGFDLLLIGFAAIVPDWFGKEGLFSHHIYRVRPKPHSPLKPNFIYHLFVSPRFHRTIAGYTNGTTVNMLPPDALEKPSLVVPPAELVEVFERIAQPMKEKAELNYAETSTLVKLRDVLLPELITGKTSVGELEDATSG